MDEQIRRLTDLHSKVYDRWDFFGAYDLKKLQVIELIDSFPGFDAISQRHDHPTIVVSVEEYYIGGWLLARDGTKVGHVCQFTEEFSPLLSELSIGTKLYEIVRTIAGCGDMSRIRAIVLFGTRAGYVDPTQVYVYKLSDEVPTSDLIVEYAQHAFGSGCMNAKEAPEEIFWQD